MNLNRSFLLASTLALVPSLTRPAWACGGLFCSASAPVNQVAERIIFAIDGDRVTQVTEVLYEGPAENFAWVLPVPGIPEVGVSSRVVLDRLQAATNPQYQLTTTFAESCQPDFANSGSNATGGSAALLGSDQEAGPNVEVLKAGTVGHYEYQLIRVKVDDEDPAQVAIDWLQENDYDVGALGPSVLRPYLANGLNLIAFRLQKNSDSGSIRPIVLEYESRGAAIPIRPTAVAATEDMGILVWLLGSSRAVPTNYHGLELNELRIDWLNFASNYNEVVQEAADEAKGQGFVTELAEPVGDLRQSLVTQMDEAPPAPPPEGTENRVELSIGQLQAIYGGYDGFQALIEELVEVRSPLTTTDLLSCLDCYFHPENYGEFAFPGVDYGTMSETDPVLSTDLEALHTRVAQDLVAPVVRTADLFKSDTYLTRLYTTMSADEMTLDPTFDLNPDLPDYSNIHQATRILGCDGTSKVVLPDGRELYIGNGADWPFLGPYNERVVTYGTSGQPKVVTSNTKDIDSLLQNSGVTTPSGEFEDTGGAREEGACSSSGGQPRKPAYLGLALLAALSLWLGRRFSLKTTV